MRARRARAGQRRRRAVGRGRSRPAGLSVLVLTKGELAQLGDALRAGRCRGRARRRRDSPELHLADTLAAGAGLCDPDAVAVLVDRGPRPGPRAHRARRRVRPTGDGEAAALALAREGGHSLARVVHAGGDATGAEIERALVAAVEALDAIEVREGWLRARPARRATAAASGVRRAATRRQRAIEVRARHTVLATGGAGQCFAVTTNPPLSTGDGIAHGAAGRRRRRRRRVHAVPPDRAAPPVDAAAAALRGAARRGRGAARRARRRVHGRRAPARRSRAPRRRRRGRSPAASSTGASTTSGSTPRRSTTSPTRFPTIWRACQRGRARPARDWLPVAPAAHYLSGGVVHRPRRRDDAARASGPAARPRARACTARTGSRRTRCSTAGVRAPRAVDAIASGQGRARRDRRAASTCSAGGRGAPVARRRRRPAATTRGRRAAGHDPRRRCAARRRAGSSAPPWSSARRGHRRSARCATS